MTTKRFRVPPAFYDDHLSRDCGETGRIVKRTTRYTIIELDAEAWIDLTTDCQSFIDYASAGAFDDNAGAFGMTGSARATLRVLNTDPFTDEELAEGHRVMTERTQARNAANREAMARIRDEMAERDAARAAEAAAHPRLRTAYTARIGMPIPWIFGLKDNTDLKVGAILLTESLTPYEVTALGDPRHGDYAATVTDRDGNEHAAKIEVSVIRP